MFSNKGAICSTVLLSVPTNVISFSIPLPKSYPTSSSLVPGRQQEVYERKIRGATSLAVVMGGAETPLSEIPHSVFGYEDSVLENVNERAISLLGQFQEASGLEQFVDSQDSLAQAASALSASLDPTRQFANAENPMASAAFSGLPDSQWMAPSAQSQLQTSVEGAMSDLPLAGSSWNNHHETLALIPDMPVDSISTSWQHVDQLPQLESIIDQPFSQLIADAAATVAQVATTTATTAAPAKAAVAQAASSAGLDSSKKLISELEKTVSSFDSLASQSGDNLEVVARQFSDQLYQSFATPEGAQTALADAPRYIAKQGDTIVQGALDGAGRILESGTSRILTKGAETLQTVKETPIKGIVNNVIQLVEQILKVLLKTIDGLLEKFSGFTFSGHLAHFKTSLTQLVAQTTGSIGASSNKVGHLSMQQIAEFMLKEVIYFVKALSGIFLSLMNALVKSFTGDTLTGNIHQLQVSVDTAVTSTVSQLTSTLYDLGQTNVNDAAKLLVSLFAFIAKLLFQLLSAFVIVLSGQGIDEWTIQATGAIKTELAAVASSAAEAGTTIAESSINELGALLLQLLENASVVLVEGMQALLESLGFLVQTGGVFAGALATDTVQSVTDGVSIMNANLY